MSREAFFLGLAPRGSGIQGSLATAQTGSKPWHCPHDTGFAGMQNARITGSWRLPPEFQRKAWQSRECGYQEKEAFVYMKL
jgi:hypothetical protein